MKAIDGKTEPPDAIPRSLHDTWHTGFEDGFEAGRCDGRTERDKLQWTLDNIYTMARRELNRLQPYAIPDTLAIERWGHVLRLCEQSGCRPRGVLKDNGGSIAKAEGR